MLQRAVAIAQWLAVWMNDSGCVNRFLGEETVNYLLGEFGIDAEYCLGGGVFYHRDGLPSVAVQPRGHALGVQDDLYGADNNATNKGYGKNPP